MALKLTGGELSVNLNMGNNNILNCGNIGFDTNNTITTATNVLTVAGATTLNLKTSGADVATITDTWLKILIWALRKLKIWDHQRQQLTD